MKKITVGCFSAEAGLSGEQIETVYYTVPDFGDTKSLFTCTHCGEIFAVDLDRLHYQHKTIDSVVAETNCPTCSTLLSESLRPYPKSFRAAGGFIGQFDPGNKIPRDDEMLLVEFWELGSQNSD